MDEGGGSEQSSCPETLLLWNSKSVSFLKISSLEILQTVEIVEPHAADSIVDVLEIKAMRYFVVATSHAKI